MITTAVPVQRIAPWLPRRLTLGSSRVIAGSAIVVSLLIGVPFLFGATTSNVPFAAAFVFFVLGGILGAIIGSAIDSGRTLVGRGVTRQSFQRVRNLTVETFGREGWVYGGETGSSVWYTRYLGANWFLFAVLLLLGIIPAVIYLIAARRYQRAEVHWSARNGATAIEITVSPKGYGGQRIADELARKLA